MWRGGGRFVGESTVSMGSQGASGRGREWDKEFVNEWGTKDGYGDECGLVDGAMKMGGMNRYDVRSVSDEFPSGSKNGSKSKATVPAAHMASR